MGDTLKLRILTPHSSINYENITALKTVDAYGHVEILPNHTALIALVKQSPTEFTDSEGREYKVSISDGIMKIRKNIISILCTEVRLPEENDMT